MQNTPLEGVVEFMLIMTSIDTDNYVSILKNLFGYIFSDMNLLCNASYVSLPPYYAFVLRPSFWIMTLNYLWITTLNYRFDSQMAGPVMQSLVFSWTSCCTHNRVTGDLRDRDDMWQHGNGIAITETHQKQNPPGIHSGVSASPAVSNHHSTRLLDLKQRHNTVCTCLIENVPDNSNAKFNWEKVPL